jgi:16S rRNA (cytosine967-C5)-methyltransferase
VACELFRQGDLYIQDEASQIAALVPPPVEGETVLDLAAAPGGKSLSLIAYQPDLRPVLADVSFARLLRARSNLLRLGRDLPLVVDDASNPAIRSAAASFDRVVIDLPCSGTGTFRKNPELKWRLTPEEIGRLSGQSRQLLDRAAERVATGGLLLAITCSIEEEENEQVSADFMAAHPNFEWVEEAKLLPCHRDVGELRDGFWRLFPEADHDGFTVQAMRRCR